MTVSWLMFNMLISIVNLAIDMIDVSNSITNRQDQCSNCRCSTLLPCQGIPRSRADPGSSQSLSWQETIPPLRDMALASTQHPLPATESPVNMNMTTTDSRLI
eukprot:m.478063 g.478063  ORF g.478063 m.478063 type:complete len:103 (-) comp45529_c0_seq1:288-596(-)